MVIETVSQLAALRNMRDRESVTIRFDDRRFAGNLPLYVIKYGLWALRPGGTLTLEAPNLLDSMVIKPGRLPFQLLVQLAARASEGWAYFTEVNVAARRLVIQRTASRMAEGWSAGIVFSGNAQEVPTLARCIQGLLAQPELVATGDIVVCGPAAGEHLVPMGQSIRYLVYDNPSEAGRFLVGRKKNLLLRELKHERVLICHSRIVLRPGALAAMPLEYDLITPKVFAQGHKAILPYLDLGFMGLATTSMVASGVQPPVYYPRERWYDHLRSLYPYIDGGLFCVRRSLALSVPLHDRIAWGEGEDAEWCLRLLNQGHLIELATDPHAAADSATCKAPRYARFGHLVSYRVLSQVWRNARTRFTGLLGLSLW
jgi:hypothetical protein